MAPGDALGTSAGKALQRLTSGYARFERSISSLSLVGGFVFDAATLKRVDMFWENVWTAGHLLLVALCILLLNRFANGRFASATCANETGPEGVEKGKGSRREFWLITVLQFLFGGLLSTFMVFYFRSGSLSVSWPFLLLLGAAFVANERLKNRYARLDFQLSLFFLSLFCFVIFVLPMVIHAMGRLVFVASGVASLALMWLFLRALRALAKENLARGWKTVAVSTGAIFVLLNVFYFLNVIPPLPLSLQDASVAHGVSRTADGNYAVASEEQGWLRFFRLVPEFHLSGGPVYLYSAVFSPTALDTEIVHEWQMYEGRRGWVTSDRIALRVRGGRDGGYRTYSMKSGVRPGAWRVNVETPAGAILGRVRFDVVAGAEPVPLKTEVKD